MFKADKRAEGVIGWGWWIAGCLLGVPTGVDFTNGDVLTPTDTVEVCAVRRDEWCLLLNSSSPISVCFLTFISSSDLRSKDGNISEFRQGPCTDILDFYT